MIRKFQGYDMEAIMKIWLESNLQAHSFIPAQYWLDNIALVREMLPQAKIYVYEDDEENSLLGFIGLMDDYIAGIFVAERFRSLGVGRELLDYVKHKKNSLILNVYLQNIRARSFYEREGFVSVDIGVDEATGAEETTMIWQK